MSSLGSNWGAFLAWNRAVSVIPQWGWWHFVRVSEPKDESNPSMTPDFALEGRQEALSFLEVSFGNRAERWGYEAVLIVTQHWGSPNTCDTLPAWHNLRDGGYLRDRKFTERDCGSRRLSRAPTVLLKGTKELFSSSHQLCPPHSHLDLALVLALCLMSHMAIPTALYQISILL